jgi:hypothetical protein
VHGGGGGDRGSSSSGSSSSSSSSSATDGGEQPAAKRSRYAAAEEGVTVGDEQDVDMVSQVADLGPIEDLEERLTTDEEYDYDRDIMNRHQQSDNLYKRAEAVVGNFLVEGRVEGRFLHELITEVGDTNAELFSSMGQSV